MKGYYSMSYNIVKSLRTVMVSCDRSGVCGLCEYIDNNEKDLSYTRTDAVNGTRKKVISIHPRKSGYISAAEMTQTTDRAYVIAKNICANCTNKFNERIKQRER